MNMLLQQPALCWDCSYTKNGKKSDVCAGQSSSSKPNWGEINISLTVMLKTGEGQTQTAGH